MVNRFHVGQLANAALTEVRRRVTLQQRGRRGRKSNREWDPRNRLTRAGARMHAKHPDSMIDDLRALPKKIGELILRAWACNEDLMDLLALHGTNPNRPEIGALLTRFYENVAASGLPETERLATTVLTWWPEIHATITIGVTNAGSEGTNRFIKTDTLRLWLPQPRQPAPPCPRRHHTPRPRPPHHPNQRTPQPTPTRLRTLTSRHAARLVNTLRACICSLPGRAFNEGRCCTDASGWSTPSPSSPMTE